MKPFTTLSLSAAFLLLAACSSSSEPASSAQDSISSSPAPSDQVSSSTSTSQSPTEPAPSTVDAGAPADSCAFGKKTASGCEVTYAIDVSAASATLPQTCNDGYTAYNDCSGGPLELSWKSLGDRAPKSAHIEVGTSIYCADPNGEDQHQSVAVNGNAIGGFDGDIASCSCNAATTPHAFEVPAAALEGYQPGRDNRLTIQGPNRCMGVGGLDGTHTVARIVVTY